MKKITITLLFSFATFVSVHAQVPVLTGVTGGSYPTSTVDVATYVNQEAGTGCIGIDVPMPPPYGSMGSPHSIGVALGVANYSSPNAANNFVFAAGNVTTTPGNQLAPGISPITIAALRLDHDNFNNSQLDFSVDGSGLCGVGAPGGYFNPYFSTSDYSGTLLGVTDPNNSSTTPLLTVATNTNNPTGFNLAALTVDYRGYTSIGAYIPADVGLNPAHLLLADPDPSGSDPLLWVYTNSTHGNNDAMVIDASGNVGIGTSVPAYPLDVSGNAHVSTNLYVGSTVQIGTTKPVTSTYNTYALSVNGNVVAQQVQVETSDWADFVFDRGYKLSSLSEIEKYIIQNHHLPDVPSECDAIDKGVNLGEMNKVLLQKVEELTLYLIQQQKEIDALKNK